MYSYAAFLGHQPQISVAELSALLPDMALVRIFEKNIAIFESEQELDQDFVHHLGGTVVLARQIIDEHITLQNIPQLLVNELSKAKKGKVTFSLRTAGITPKTIRDLYRSGKRSLKNAGRPSRYVGTEKKAAISVVLHDSDLIEGKQGCELVILQDSQKDLWVGRTVGAQNIHEYTKRDMEKPVCDKGVGILPPKLAQILLNIGVWAVAQQSKSKKLTKKWKLPHLTVFDPFCGTGVIPLECLLRHSPVLASDISQKAVNGCTTNIAWMRKQYDISENDTPSSTWKHDVTKSFTLTEKPDVIVTETTLGPNLLKKPTLKDVQKMCTENEAIQKAFLENASKNLPGVPLVCTLPVWLHSQGKTYLKKIWKVAENNGYKAILPSNIDPHESEKGLLYRRPNQMVGREIVIFMPTS